MRHAVVPHGGFTDPEYGSVGLTEEEARREQDCAVAVVPYADLDRGIIDGRQEGSCKLIVSRETRRVLGAHIVGEQAVEVVQVAATAMRAGMRIEQLADLELAYPTFTAVVGLAARRISRSLGLVPRALAEHDGRERFRAAEWELRSG
jgi:pyruvate/2-oxoglutarate dehydrogenase complex dihydrolipoamide dehydrogenase (E3) component